MAGRIRGIIFDMDGVLCLSEPFIAEAACRMFAETYRLTVTPADFRPFVGTGEDRFLGGVAEKYGVKLTMPRDKQRTYEIYLDLIKGRLQPLPGVKKFIQSCRRRKLKLAVATSADRVKLEGNLREIGLPATKFDATVHGEEIAQKKPAPDIFLLAAQRLGLEPGECLVIEDAPSGVAAARAGGFRCLALTTTFPAEQLPADGVAADLEQVPKAVTKLFPKTAAQPVAPQPVVAAEPKMPGLKILFVAAECTPYAKTGGLGDVVAGLAKALRRMGHDARVILPLYRSVDRAKHGVTPFSSTCVHMGGRVEHWCGVHQARLDDEVPVWFLEYDAYFGRDGIYGYEDDGWRFAMFSKAAMQVAKDQQFHPDVMHVHDWHTAPVAAFLKTWDRIFSPLSQTASVLTIHNIGYQGFFPASLFSYLGIGGEHFTSDKFESYGQVNLLKAGIAFADAITTVSPTHAQEILDPIGGMGLAPYVTNRRNDFFGILNGCDYEHWNPATDRHLPARYHADDLSGKAICKAELQKRMGLAVDDRVPLFGVVSRFAPQKGFHLLAAILPRALTDMQMQFVVLGSGDPATEEFFRRLPALYPGRVGSYIGFDINLSHLIEAGSDFFLMPSLYEPCGLNQMYSLKYGTLPIVRATGGLHDTVENYDERSGAGTGFKFWDATPDALYYTIGWAVSTWYDRPHHIQQLRRQAMARDFSWNDSAAKYVEVYQHALTNRRGLV
jgi:starch synthase